MLDDTSELPPPPPPPPPRPRDTITSAVDAWGTAPQPAIPTRLDLARIDEDERVFIPFTADVAQVKVHYDNLTNDTTRCAGSDCLLCRLGERAKPKTLLPVYDPIAERVVVLPVTPARGVGKLAPQLLGVLDRVAHGGREMLIISKRGRFDFDVRAELLPVDAADGRDAIAEFKIALAAGDIAISDVYPAPSNAELAENPAIARKMQLRGVKL
jgi:hypothetical protein